MNGAESLLLTIVGVLCLMFSYDRTSDLASGKFTDWEKAGFKTMKLWGASAVCGGFILFIIWWSKQM